MNDFKTYLRVRTYIIGLIACAMALACAQQGSIQGGKKDEVPPKVVSSLPPDRSVQIHPKTIQIQFNEYVQLNDQSKNVVFSPPMKYPAEVKIVKKSIVVNLRDTLKLNKTYSILFNKGIGDLNENNLLHDYSYVFSTGDHIDSLRLSGVVLDALTHRPLKECIVMVLDSANDFEDPDRLPAHLAQSGEDGSFRMLYMPSGCFRVYALKDNNRNYTYDSLQDELGYTDGCHTSYYEADQRDTLGHLIASPIKDSVRVYLYKPEQPLQVKDAAFTNAYTLKIEYNRPPNEISQLHFLGGVIDSSQYRAIWREDGLSCQIYFRSAAPDQLSLLVYNLQSRDTLKLLNTHKAQLDSNQFKLLMRSNVAYFDTIRFESTFPIDSVLVDRFTLIQEKDTLSVPFTLKTGGTVFEIHAVLAEQSNYHLKIPAGTLIDFYGRSNDSSFSFQFRSNKRSMYASIEFTLKDKPLGQGLFQVLDGADKVVYQERVSDTQDKVAILSRLLPGSYSFRWIEDLNGNERWDVGRYSLRLSPERVFYFSKIMNLEADWEYEETWSILGSPFRKVEKP